MFTNVITNNWTEALQSALLQPLQQWLSTHPLLAWLVAHPLWSLALVVVVILLFAGLWSAIARLTESFWLTLVRLPFQSVAWLFTTLAGGLIQRWMKSSTPASSPDRLSEIMMRLEALQTEQDTLLKEMRQILGDTPQSHDHNANS
jgi:hypothetical protein